MLKRAASCALEYFAHVVLYRTLRWGYGYVRLYPLHNWCMLASCDLRRGTKYLAANREAKRESRREG